jgi:hypothetical protein
MPNRCRRVPAVLMPSAVALAALSCVSCAGTPDADDFWKKERAGPSGGPTRSELTALRPRVLPAESPDALVAQARKERASGDELGALITLMQAKTRDPLHLDANELYQDIRLFRGAGGLVHREYTELLNANPDSGAALYLYVRPFVVNFSGAPGGPERLDKATLDTLDTANSKLRGGNEIPAMAGYASVLRADRLCIPANIALQDEALKKQTAGSSTREAIAERYEKLRAEHETDARGRYLYERVAGETDRAASCVRFARDIALGLPPYYLWLGLSDVCNDRLAASAPQSDTAPAMTPLPEVDRAALQRLQELLTKKCREAEKAAG